MSTFMAVLFNVSTLILLIGVGRKIWQYYKTPSPLKIPTTPAPVTQTGVVFRMIREVVFFQSLFKSNKTLWLLGWMFHVGLFLALARHLRYFTQPVWFWVELIQPFGKYAAFAMVAGLIGLWIRRIVIDRVRYISSPSDHLMLLLLIAIGMSGIMMKFVSHTDIVGLKMFVMGLMHFDWQPLPSDPALIVHLLLVNVLMIIFPISKLLHVPGVFFSPTRNQVDNPREKRHLAPWAAELEQNTDVKG